ncbi:MAG: hypothetical protein ACI9G9_000174 [Psychromonas sp.]|jgi:hypothetical protein
MNQEHQHYVPKSYLRNFCIDETEKVHRSKYILHQNKWLISPPKHINQICYGQDFYDILNEIAVGNDIDIDVVERKAFWYEKSYLKDLIHGVDHQSFDVDQIDSIAHFYLSMTARNPVFRNALDEKKMEGLIIEEFELIEKKMQVKMENIQNEKFALYFKDQIKIARKKLIEQNSKAMIHNTTLLNQHFGNSPTFDSLVAKVSTYKKLFIKINDPNDFFITSNSPGFSIDTSNNVFGFKFKDDVAHYMPISSKVSIALMNPAIFMENPDIAIVNASKSLISYINKNTLVSNKNEIYCSNKEQIEELINANNRPYKK